MLSQKLAKGRGLIFHKELFVTFAMDKIHAFLGGTETTVDLPPGRPSVITRVLGFVIRSPTLDRPKAGFSGFAQGDGLVTPPDFVSMIGTLLPIAPCGRSSL